MERRRGDLPPRRIEERLRPVLPEGHRSRDRRLQPFYSGAFRMAIETGLPWCRFASPAPTSSSPGGALAPPADVRLRALPAVDPAGFQGRRADAILLLRAGADGVRPGRDAGNGRRTPQGRDGSMRPELALPWRRNGSSRTGRRCASWKRCSPSKRAAESPSPSSRERA